MIRVGITGGIGSGKSVVTRVMKALGYPVYIADEAAKRLMNTDCGIRDRLIELLGPEVYAEGMLNKKLLADFLFSGPQSAECINSIVHPVVRADYQNWLRAQTADLTVMESAILYEAGFQNEVDVVWMVSAPVEVRVSRAMRRDSASRESIERRIASQMNDSSKCRMADFIINNAEGDLLLPQLLHLIPLLSENNDYLCRPK